MGSSKLSLFFNYLVLLQIFDTYWECVCVSAGTFLGLLVTTSLHSGYRRTRTSLQEWLWCSCLPARRSVSAICSTSWTASCTGRGMAITCAWKWTGLPKEHRYLKRRHLLFGLKISWKNLNLSSRYRALLPTLKFSEWGRNKFLLMWWRWKVGTKAQTPGVGKTSFQKIN